MSNNITMNADRNVITLRTGQDVKSIYNFTESRDVEQATESTVVADLMKAGITFEVVETVVEGLVNATAKDEHEVRKYAAGRDHVETVISSLPFAIRPILYKVFHFEPIRSRTALQMAIRALRVVLSRVLYVMHQGIEHDLAALKVVMSEEGVVMGEGYELRLSDIHTVDGPKGIFVYRGFSRVAQLFGGSTEVRLCRLAATPYAITVSEEEAQEEAQEESTGQTLREAQEELSTQLSCNAMSEDEAICIQFFGLFGAWFWVSTDKFASYEGDLHEMLTDHGVTDENADEILNRDWAYADYQGAATRQCASEWSFDWSLYNAIQESDMELEAIIAGLELGLAMDDIEDKYYGHFESEEDLAYEHVESTGMFADVPDSVASYFDYERFGRDLAMDFSVHDNHYFSH